MAEVEVWLLRCSVDTLHDGRWDGSSEPIVTEIEKGEIGGETIGNRSSKTVSFDGDQGRARHGAQRWRDGAGEIVVVVDLNADQVREFCKDIRNWSGEMGMPLDE